jgi:hypothetical protein
MTARRPRANALGLTVKEAATLRRHATPHALQAFVNAIPANLEPDGDTCYTVKQVLKYRRAHCIEAALVAACALWLAGEPPLLLDMRARRDYDHVVALFRRNGLWGAISKSNHVALRGRDPVYRNMRELALSYFHEYHNEHGEKTLREYSRPLDLRRVPIEHWISGETGAWEVEQQLDAIRHYRLFPGRQGRYISAIDAMEWKAKRIVEYQRAPAGKVNSVR